VPAAGTVASVDGSDLRERNRAAAMAGVQDVALRLMLRHGFDGVTVAQIAAEAGMSPSTVYRYFGTKEELVLFGGGTDRLVPTVDAAARADPSATLTALLQSATQTVFGDIDHAALLDRLRVVFADDGLTAYFEHRILDRRHELADVFAAHRGAAKRGIRDDAAAGAVLGMILSVLDRWQRGAGGKPLIRTLDKAIVAMT